jgi:hypothetical protein
MKRVIIESPYAGKISDNTAYLKRCLRDSIDRGEAPLASHLLYPYVLREDLQAERQLGIELGYEWWYGARCIVFYCDKGWSPGMKAALERAKRLGKEIKFRCLDNLGVGLGLRYSDIAPEAGNLPSAREEAKPPTENLSADKAKNLE